MSVFTARDTLPDWSELRAFSCHAPAVGLSLPRRCPRERVLVTRGRCVVSGGAGSQVLRAGQFLDLAEADSGWQATGVTGDAELLQLSGVWGADLAGCGIWSVADTPGATDPGDPVDYPKRTRIDRHYHDYDEFWFVLDGAATAVIGDTAFEIGAGDCLATAAGHPHDLPVVHGTFRAAFFETSLRGAGRIGHLWEHTHGPAPRDMGRV